MTGHNLASLTRLVNKESKEVLRIPINDIVSKKQVRTQFSNLEDLANSLKEEGQQQPITVAPVNSIGKYTIIIGERRWRAAKLAGFDTIEAIVNEKNQSQQDLIAGQLVENIQREDLTPLEIAASIKELLDSGWSNRKIGQRLGKSDTYVSLHASLIDLPDEVEALFHEGHTTDSNSLSLLGKMYELDKEKTLVYIQDIKEDKGNASRKAIRQQYSLMQSDNKPAKSKPAIESGKPNTPLTYQEEEEAPESTNGLEVQNNVLPVGSEHAPTLNPHDSELKEEKAPDGLTAFGARQIDPRNIIIEVMIIDGEHQALGQIIVNALSKNTNMLWVLVDGKAMEVSVDSITILGVRD